MPNNRQLAVMIWLLVLVASALLYPRTRRSLADVVRAGAKAVILIPVIGMTAWTAGLVYLGRSLHVWSADLTTDTIFWFFSAGMVLFWNFGHVTTQRKYVRETAMAVFEVTLVVDVIAELFVLPLAWELLLQPVFALLAMLSVVAAQRPEHRQVKSFADGLMGVLGLGILAYVGFHVVDDWGSIDALGAGRELVLPIWLTVGALPYIYVVGLFAGYQMAFVRIDFRSKRTWSIRFRSKLALLLCLRFRAEELGRFNGSWQLQIAEATSFRDAREVVRRFRESERRRVEDDAEAAARLARLAGADGVDDSGRRLDQREFSSTTAALRWLATCQMGWHRRPGGQYRDDLLEVLAGTWGSTGLPEPPGIEMFVGGSGDSWYAWRRTISGWVFAIGAAGPPPDQWTFDGPTPPIGPPGVDPAWGTSPFVDDVSPNW